MFHRQQIHVRTEGRSTVDLSSQIRGAVRESGIQDGLCHVFVHHTSASLILCENADPQVRRDLETWFSRAVPDGDPDYGHISEGPDDMPAHVRSVLTGGELTVPVAGGDLDLGTWQGVYLYEHRHRGHGRRISLSVMGA